MEFLIEYVDMDEALRRAGSTWGGAQAHGLLCGQLSVGGVNARAEWLRQVLEGCDSANALRGESEMLLNRAFDFTHRQLSGRQSEFQLLLPADNCPTIERVAALAHWCEGFLHGLVSSPASPALKKRLAEEPISEVIQDFLQITRAYSESEDESTESAYVEVLEYVRVTAQVVYEELAENRGPLPESSQLH